MIDRIEFLTWQPLTLNKLEQASAQIKLIPEKELFLSGVRDAGLGQWLQLMFADQLSAIIVNICLLPLPFPQSSSAWAQQTLDLLD